MRFVIVSDIHGNIDALEALSAQLRATRWQAEAILVLGDLVDYGPEPEPVIDWVRGHAGYVVRGNHDHAMGTGEDCRSSALFHPLAVATREYFRSRLGPDALTWLATLPLTATLQVGASVWQLVHATPRDPLFEYLRAAASDEAWHTAVASRATGASVILVGHSHEAFVRGLGDLVIVNPGSLGLPKDGDSRGCYAIWEHGTFGLHRLDYDVHRAASRLRALGLPNSVTDPLSTGIVTGDVAHLRKRTN